VHSSPADRTGPADLGAETPRVVLLAGASGFIGSHLRQALVAAGHRVVCTGRPDSVPDPGCAAFVPADYARDHTVEAWLPRLSGVDVVVNAVGILQESPGKSFSALHVQAPVALFAACAEARVGLVVQISALGADAGAQSSYHRSKKAADDFLAALDLPWVILQPSLVYGPGGASARLFGLLASLPLIPLPGKGLQQVQPVHVDDLAAAVVALVDRPPAAGLQLPVVGPEALTLREFLQRLRAALELSPGRFLPVPMPLVRLAARLGAKLPGGLLDDDTLAMLERGNVADAAPVTRLLGRPARGVERFLASIDIEGQRLAAQLGWLLPLLRLSIAAVWIVTGLVSLWGYPIADSLALLARTGFTGRLAVGLLYGAALLDLALGVATLVMRNRRWLWIFQLGVILFYTAVITLRLPEFWLHPYGPVLKNIPLAMLIWAMLNLEEPNGLRRR
jgi:uncharacterized protein YbjT (DUF2867 family)